ncbi:MAG: protein kinase [Myxococcaceae bacterium]|nr:protein kinase [Myxococcaceae bacterium]
MVNLIGHENIVRIFDMNRLATGEWYLVMEYLPGQMLSELAARPLDERAARHLLGQVLDALEAAHARGIVHRDVKPENVFVVRRADGTPAVKLLDFGIAHFFQGAHAGCRT